MKLLTFQDGDARHIGVLTDKGIVDLTALGHSPAFSSMQALIEAGPAALKQAEELVASSNDFRDPASVQFLAPLPAPIQMRDTLCFELHLKNAAEAGARFMAMQADDPEAAMEQMKGRANPMLDAFHKHPIYYKANRFAVTATDTDVVWPAYSQIMDFELEMACVIGKTGRDIPKEKAREHIFGFTVFNDFSARDAQLAEQQGMLGPCKGKDFDNANPMGPVLVTLDEIGDPYDLAMKARVNGETWCDSSSSTMHWSFEDVIAYISQGETLYAGEVIGSGTVGWGCGMEHLRFLSDGDVVELEIEKIGILRNRVRKAA